MEITGERQNLPTTSTVLSKMFVEEKPPLHQEPAPATDMEKYGEMSVAVLYHQYETRLSQNRAHESALVALMKEKYEV